MKDASLRTWEVPVIISVSVGGVVLISIAGAAYFLGRRVNKVFEEVVIGDNIHTTEKVDSSNSTPQGFIESKRQSKTPTTKSIDK